MKKVIILLIALLLPMFATKAFAYDIAVKNADGVTIFYNKWENTLSVTYSGETFYDHHNNYAGNIDIPSSVEYDGKKYTVTSIGDYAFYRSDLTSVTIPNSVTSIGMEAFERTGLTSIIFPNSVTNIRAEAFYECYSLTSITIPSSVTDIGGDAFYECRNLKDVYITDLEAWCNNNYGDYPRANHHLYLNGDEITDLVIPKNVTSIRDHAFQNCIGLTSVTIPNSVTSVGNNAFYGCTGITSVSLSNGLTLIGSSAFEGCESISSITIPSSVSTIDNDAFKNCTRLRYIISEIQTPFDIQDNVFEGIDTYHTLTVPFGLKSAYLSMAGWNKFQIIIEEGGIDYVFESGGIYYLVGENNTVSVRKSQSYTGEIVIPSQVTFNGNIYSVTSVGMNAFTACSGLVSVTIPNSVTNISSSAFYSSSVINVSIPNSVTMIDEEVFMNCSNLSSLTIPNSVTSIGNYAFYGCSSLTSFTIPNNVTSIGNKAFWNCSGITSIISEINNPFEIGAVFGPDIYSTAKLIVPIGTKSLYQSTTGWNKFQNIVEAESDESVFDENGVTYLGTASTLMAVVQSVSNGLKNVVIPESVYYNGKTYQVTAVDDQAFMGLDVNYISIPASVTSITDRTFSRCNMGALVWNAEMALPGNTFSNASMGTDANFLLYVKSASYAPSTVKNVVVNGTALSVLLSDDGGKFYCPEQFKANSISYTHYYSMETGGNGKGWETLALPFDVQKISHSTRGEIIPFAAYRSGSSQKPFWLANFTVSGFKRSSAIMANEPYIIAMPNSSNYNNNYNLAGSVTFSSEDIIIPKTPTFNGTFLPAFTTVPKVSNVYALNVNNRNVTYSGTYDAGSRFISNLRDVRPFEAYMTGNNSTRGVIEINFDDGMTDIDDILLTADEDQEITIHTLSGQEVARTILRDFDQIWSSLPMGVYIVNGKKWIK